MKILVTDGENRSALAVTRSLGRKGHSMLISGPKIKTLAACSTYCRKSFAVPDPLEHSENYSEAIAEIVLREKVEVIFPVSEQSIYCLNNYRSNFDSSVIMACEQPEKMEAVSNKFRLFQMAEHLGIAMPRTRYVNCTADFFTQYGAITEFPVVVKPAFSKIIEGEKIISSRVMYAYDREELCRLYETNPALRYPSMIQELIVGEGTGLFTLFDRDRHLALFSHRRLLEKPPSGGVSVLSESVALDQEMIEAARKLLAEVAWSGIAMVEFKRDIRDGSAKLMEINGRFWGSLQLAVAAGVDFPMLCLDYYLGKNPASLHSDYLVGHRLKWFFGILDHLIIRLKNNSKHMTLPPEIPGMTGVLSALLRSGGGNTSQDVYDPKDLVPFISETGAYVMQLFGRSNSFSRHQR